MKKFIASLILIISLVSSANAGGLGFRIGYVVASTNPHRVGRIYVGPRYYFHPLAKKVIFIRK